LFSDCHASKKAADIAYFPAYRLSLKLQFPEYTTRHAYRPPVQLAAQSQGYFLADLTALFNSAYRRFMPSEILFRASALIVRFFGTAAEAADVPFPEI
jgi:hypothetical protein